MTSSLPKSLQIQSKNWGMESGPYCSKSDGTVQHFLNNHKVVEYVRGSQAFKDLVAQSKFKGFEGFGLSEKDICCYRITEIMFLSVA